MICGWKELLGVLPSWLGRELDRYYEGNPQELRLRIGQPPLLLCAAGERFLPGKITAEDIQFCVNTATKYSPWAATTIAEGFVTAPGGHRIGICGEAVGADTQFRGIKNYRSLCIRIASDHPGIGRPVANLPGSILIIGRPGSGKTTLLRDLVRQLSKKETVGVIDQRSELFPACFSHGERTDILSGCPKDRAVDILLRTMGPDSIAMDEITRETDCNAIVKAAWCGVRLIATAHAADERELQMRNVYKPILEAKVFDHLVVLQKDKSYRTERI